MSAIKHIQSGTVIRTTTLPTWINGTWECGDSRYLDTDKSKYQAVPDAPKVSPVTFLLLFTSQERVAIKAVIAGDTSAAHPVAVDPVIADWWSIVTDPRLTFVDLSLESTQQALAYLVTRGLIAADRPAQIITGIIQ